MKIRNILRKQRETIDYLFFGVLAVLVNTISYLFLIRLTSDVIANTAAFFITVVFAYYTNCRYVFKEKSSRDKFIKFFLVRTSALPFDDIILLALRGIGFAPFCAKVITNILIIIYNYIMSKFVIFKKKEEL